jgi:hypothetical protein
MNMGTLHVSIEVLIYDWTVFWRQSGFVCDWKPVCRFVDGGDD